MALSAIAILAVRGAKAEGLATGASGTAHSLPAGLPARAALLRAAAVVAILGLLVIFLITSSPQRDVTDPVASADPSRDSTDRADAADAPDAPNRVGQTATERRIDTTRSVHTSVRLQLLWRKTRQPAVGSWVVPTVDLQKFGFRADFSRFPKGLYRLAIPRLPVAEQ